MVRINLPSPIILKLLIMTDQLPTVSQSGGLVMKSPRTPAKSSSKVFDIGPGQYYKFLSVHAV